MANDPRAPKEWAMKIEDVILRVIGGQLRCIQATAILCL
jgi:hypothetical protein